MQNIYASIYESIKKDIVEGKLGANDRLPSIREQARQLSVSTTPVEAAYQQLAAEGFIESRPRKGFFVAALPVSYGQFTLADQQSQPVHFEREHVLEDAYLYDFHLCKNDFTGFPINHWKRLLTDTLRDEYNELLFYGDYQGEAGLREELAAYLYRIRGVVCRKEQIVIGAEQHLLLHYLAILLKDISPVMAVEDPCYPLLPYTFQAEGYEISYVTEADQGINISRLLQTSARIVAVSPSHQYPGGRVMPINERMELLRWAEAHGGYIIEDDYGGELRYLGQPVPALQGLAPGASVVYIGGFSQILAPDICIHYMVLPDSLLDAYHYLRRRLWFEQSSSRIYQRTLEKFMEQGYFEKHVRRMRNLYRKKSHHLAEALQTHFQGYGEVISPHTGFHLILSLRTSAPEQQLVELSRSHGIVVASATAFYGDKSFYHPSRRFLIGFGGVVWERIDEGVALLREIWAPYFFVEGKPFS